MSSIETLENRLKVSVVGVRGQAARHIQLINSTPGIELQHVYYPKSGIDELQRESGLPLTALLTRCMDSDAIVIASPTSVHFSQIEALEDYPGYILLEKPAVANKTEIDQIKEISDARKFRTKVNFNFQFNPVAEILKKVIADRLIGDLIHTSFETNHGGAFKADWGEDWRTTDKFSGPIFTVGIHYIQWITAVLGKPLRTDVQTTNRAGNSYDDTGSARLIWDGGITASVMTSYASPFKVNFQITGTDGYVVYDGKSVKLYSPRDTFDENGFFTNPPESLLLESSWNEAYSASLKRSHSAFWEHVKSGKSFELEEFYRDVEIMSTLIDGATS